MSDVTRPPRWITLAFAFALAVIGLFALTASANATGFVFGNFRAARLNAQARQVEALNRLQVAQLNSLAIRQQVVAQPVVVKRQFVQQVQHVQAVQAVRIPVRVQQVQPVVVHRQAVQVVTQPVAIRQQTVIPVKTFSAPACAAFFGH